MQDRNRENRDKRSRDVVRLCPSCRMEISAFASKCFHCGEYIQQYIALDRKLTAEQLGETRGPRDRKASSESVVQAMASVRAEMVGDKRNPSDPITDDELDVPLASPDASKIDAIEEPLVARGIEDWTMLSSAVTTLPPSEKTTRGSGRGPSWVRRTCVFGAFVAGSMLLYFGSIQVAGIMKDFKVSDPPAPVQMEPNPAAEILAGTRQGTILEALELASTTVRRQDTPRNRAVIEEVRIRFADEVRAILNAAAWTPDSLSRAVELAARGLQIDNCPSLGELYEEVSQEQCAYMMVPTRFAPDDGRGAVSFRLNRLLKVPPHLQGVDGVVSASVGESVLDRFKVLKVEKTSVLLEDTLRARTVRFSLDGTVVLVSANP